MPEYRAVIEEIETAENTISALCSCYAATSRRRLNVPTVTVTLPTRDIIVDPMSLAGIEPPPALQTNISSLDTQSDMNIYHDFDPIIDRSTWTRDRMPRIVVSGSNVLICLLTLLLREIFKTWLGPPSLRNTLNYYQLIYPLIIC